MNCGIASPPTKCRKLGHAGCRSPPLVTLEQQASEVGRIRIKGVVSYTQRHKYEKMLPSLDKRGSAGVTHHPSHGLRHCLSVVELCGHA